MRCSTPQRCERRGWAGYLRRWSPPNPTTESAGHIAWLHDRLPLFLRREEIEQWVHGTPKDAVELVRPSRVAQDLFWRPSAQEVGNVRNDYAELMGDGAMGKAAPVGPVEGASRP